jgi:hypothetical protein
MLGDFNIDLLKINENPAVKEYFENLITLGMYPEITLPTRITDTSATLIDNIFSNVSMIHVTQLVYFCLTFQTIIHTSVQSKTKQNIMIKRVKK